MDGWEFLERLRSDARLRSVPVAIMSALSVVGDSRALLIGRGARFLPKPMSIDQLFTVVDEFAARRI